MSIASNIDFLKHLPRMPDQSGPVSAGPLVPVESFGANPGNLAMWCYVPPKLPSGSPLVVVLHGCTQTAAAFDHGSGWTALAARHGFAVLMPEQQRGNNPNLCFNWFDPAKTVRGGGEVLSIHRMIATMVRLHKVSPQRIFIVGLSAGGAMASAMLAVYPEVFAAGAIIAGLPHGVAGNVREALVAMAKAPARSDEVLGNAVREASPHQGRWPRISVWHGTADRVVAPGNADQIVAQWRDVHRLPRVPTHEERVDGHARAIWTDPDGAVLLERYTVDGLGHGVPLATNVDDVLGAHGPFMLDAGIASTQRIAEFFGIASAASKSGAERPASGRTASEQPLDVAGFISRVLSAAGLNK